MTMKAILVSTICLFTFLMCPNVPLAQALKTMRVEGHVFSASTRRPLTNARVELWAFLSSDTVNTAVQSIFTDEGGFYRYEFHPIFSDLQNNDLATGYAFAIVCKYRGTEVAYIMPLYTSLERGVVYHRNAYLQVPSGATRCDS